MKRHVLLIALASLALLGALVAFIVLLSGPGGQPRKVSGDATPYKTGKPKPRAFSQQEGRFTSDLFVLTYPSGTSAVEGQANAGQVQASMQLPGDLTATVVGMDNPDPYVVLGAFRNGVKTKREGNSFVEYTRSGNTFSAMRLRFSKHVAIQTFVSGPASRQAAIKRAARDLSRRTRPAPSAGG